MLKISEAMFTLYRTVKRSIAGSVPDRVFVHTRNAAFEAVSAPEQYCSASLLKVERSVSDRFLKRSESSLNTTIGADPFKSKGSIANCMMNRVCVHTGKALEQFVFHKRTLIFVLTVSEQLLKWSKNLSGTL